MKVIQLLVLVNAVLCRPTLSESQRDQKATKQLISRMRKQTKNADIRGYKSPPVGVQDLEIANFYLLLLQPYF